MCSNHFSEDFHGRVHDMQQKKIFKVFKRYERSELISKSKIKKIFKKRLRLISKSNRILKKN